MKSTYKILAKQFCNDSVRLLLLSRSSWGYHIRRKHDQAMLDFHLAIMYNVETRVLKQQIKRNLDRFPEDFMFQLTRSEWHELINILQ